MKIKRLDRDTWGFQHFPFYQMRVEAPGFCGLAALIDLVDGETIYWHMPKAGKAPVCGAGMKWLQMIPDGEKNMLTTKYQQDGEVSVWYADVIGGVRTDPDGVAVYEDLYLDVIFTPEGDVMVDDRDEAFHAGELSREQYQAAIAEAERIRRKYCRDLKRTEELCGRVLAKMLEGIAQGEGKVK